MRIGIKNPFNFSRNNNGSVIVDNSFILTREEAYCPTNEITREIMNNETNFFL
jgi:hypothetical protein